MDTKKLSTQQDYREAPVGTVVKNDPNFRGLNAYVKGTSNSWTNTATGAVRTDFQMSGDIREVITVIEEK